MTLAHILGIKAFHVEYLAMGAAIGGLGAWMWRTGADRREGIVMIVVGAGMAAAAFVLS